MATSPVALQHALTYDGQMRRLFGISLKNLLLSFLTLGLYSFWGKTKVRQYIAHRFSLLDDRFEYNGTGGELLRGFLKGILIVSFVYMLLVISPLITHSVLRAACFYVGYLALAFLYFLGNYSALRYKLSRTTWRGIQGRLTGSAFVFARKSIIFVLFKIFTLGMAIPIFDIKKYRLLANNIYFGNAKADFSGTHQGLWRIHVITLLLAIPTLGLSRFWYAAALIRHQYAHTKIKNLQLKATHTGGGLLKLTLGNILIAVFTLGIGMPVVLQRYLRYFSQHVSIIGDLNTSDILQSDEKLNSSGEALYGALDISPNLELSSGIV